MGMGTVRISNPAGDMEILAAGSFITWGSGETVMDVEYEQDHIRLIIGFDDTKKGERQHRTFELIDPTTLRITFINYTNVLGTHAGPAQIGTIAHTPLWLAYRVVHLKEIGSKHFTYSLYVGPKREVQDG